MPLEPESRLRDTFDGGIDIGIGIDDDGIFATHFEDGALDPELAGSLRGGGLVDVEADFTRAGECDVAGFGMSNDSIAETRAGAGTEVDDTFGNARFFEQFDELRGDGGRVARRFQNHGVAADDGSYGHAGHDGAGKIPRRNHRAHAEWNVDEGIALAGQLHRSFGLG